MKTGLFFFLVVICVLPAEAQCAMCRAVIESEESGEMAKGINNGFPIYSRWRNWLYYLSKSEKNKVQSSVTLISSFLV